MLAQLSLHIRILLVLLFGVAIAFAPATTDKAHAVEIPNLFVVVTGGKDTKVENNYGEGPYAWLHGYEISPFIDTDRFRLKEGEGNGCMKYTGLGAADGWWYVNDSGNWFKVAGASTTHIHPMEECKRRAGQVHGFWAYK